jgi:DNA-binding Lrp family transcriptional regulator
MQTSDSSTNHNRFEASVNIFVDPLQKKQVLEALSKLESLEEIYEVTGEYDIISIVSTSCIEEFRDVLQKKIMKIKGIRSTITTIILSHKVPKHLVTKAKTLTK